jgi:hypothetical protein
MTTVKYKISEGSIPSLSGGRLHDKFKLIFFKLWLLKSACILNCINVIFVLVES